MNVINEVMPTSAERIEQMMEPGPDGPISMVNLLKFKEHAEYEDGRETTLTGRQAYEIYGRGVSQLITEYGGTVTFAGDVTFLALGQVDELWDEVAIAQYPSRQRLRSKSQRGAANLVRQGWCVQSERALIQYLVTRSETSDCTGS